MELPHDRCSETVSISIPRGAPGEESPETYDVPYREGMSVLDAVVGFAPMSTLCRVPLQLR